jgi:hypothetical protein
LLYNFHKSSPGFIWKSATDGSISNVPFIADDASWICRGREAVEKFFDLRSQRFLHEQCHRGGYSSGIPEMDDHFTSFSIWERESEQQDDCVANNDVVVFVVEGYTKGLRQSFWDAEDGMNGITEVPLVALTSSGSVMNGKCLTSSGMPAKA